MGKATSILPDVVYTDTDATIPEPVMLALGSVMFTGLAIASWRERYPKHPPERPIGPIPEARLAEITSWLHRKITVDEAHEIIRNGSADGGETPAAFDSWYTTSARPGDELWFYDTPAEAWDQLGGENGFALVQGGKVVEFMMWWMN